MSAVQNADGTTSGVSGKVKAGTYSAVIASALVSFLFQVFGPALVHAGVSQSQLVAAQPLSVAVVTGLVVFVAGYLARHVSPKQLQVVETLGKDVVDAWAAEKASVVQRSNVPNDTTTTTETKEVTAPTQ